MEYKIKRLADGGGFASFTPIIHTSPTGETNSRSSQSSSSSSSDAIAGSSIIDEKMLENLYKTGGLVNDVNKLVSELVQLERSSSNPYLQTGNRSSALHIAAKINEVNQNRKYWEDAITRSKEAGGLGEVAVDTDGKIFVKTKNNQIESISVKDYARIGQGKKVLSVQELLYERQYNPSLTNQNGVFTVADNAIGINKITEQIQKMISVFGKESAEENTTYARSDAEKYMQSMVGKTPTQQEAHAMSVLKQVLSNPSEYSTVETKNSSERNNLNRALKYIWTSLGKPAQQKLQASAVLNGTTPEEFIWEKMINETDHSTSSIATPKSTEGASGKSSSSENSGEKSLTQFQIVHRNRLMNPQSVFNFNDPKLGVLFKGTVGSISPVITKDGDSVGMATISDILTKAGYNQFLESDKVYFGDNKVDQLELNNLVYDGNDGAKIYMPVDNAGAPDFAAMSKFKEVYAIYEANKKTWSAKTAMDYFKKFDYDLQIEESIENGESVQTIKANSRVKPFWVMYGYTNDATSLTENNSLITKLSSEEESLITPKLKQVWQVASGKKVIDGTPDAWGWEDYFKGMIMIPYKREAGETVNAMVGQGAKEKIQPIGVVQANLTSSNQPVTRSTSAFDLNTQ